MTHTEDPVNPVFELLVPLQPSRSCTSGLVNKLAKQGEQGKKTGMQHAGIYVEQPLLPSCPQRA